MSNDILGFILPLAVFILIFYFLMLRPQKKEAEKRMNMLRAVKIGDKIETISRVIGEVVSVEGEEIVVDIADSSSREPCKVRMGLEAVSRVLNATAEPEKEKLTA